jgi:hypothetical protein
VTVPILALEDPVRPHQARDKKILAHLLLERREARSETLMDC